MGRCCSSVAGNDDDDDAVGDAVMHRGSCGVVLNARKDTDSS